MSDHSPPPADPRTVRETGRRRVRALTAGLAAAAVVGTGTVAIVAASGNDDSTATTTASSSSATGSSGDQRSWTPSGATVTHGSGGSGAATSGGS